MHPEQIEIYRAMSPAEKLRLAARLHADSRRLKTAALRTLHPDWDEERIARSVRELFLHAAS